MGYLPEPLKDQVKTVMKAAYRLSAEEGMARLKQQAIHSVISNCALTAAVLDWGYESPNHLRCGSDCAGTPG